MKEKLLTLMNEETYIPVNLEGLQNGLGVDASILTPVLEELKREFVIRETKRHKFGLLKHFNLHLGKIDIKDKGFGFIRSEEFLDEFFVPKLLVGDAMDNDLVLFSITDENTSFGKKEATVVEVVKRALTQVIGKIVIKKNKNRFVADDVKCDILFEVLDFGISVPGDVVIFKIIEVVNSAYVRGKIIEVIGNINDVGIDIKSVAYKYGFVSEFPSNVLDQVKKLSIDINEERKTRKMIAGNIITIDGEDAKDLDDAVSIERLANGNYKLGVYIADVSYYVNLGSPLDEEAYQRGTSVYLADRVIPMLPHKLSNDLCSLNPEENKLVIACEMEINHEGHVVSHDIFPGIIRTVYRMTYTNVNHILEDDDALVKNNYQSIVSMLYEMRDLALILRTMRNKRGALDFDIPESKIIVDEAGCPIDVILRTRGVGEKLIEEFMLIANETVAETITHLGLPFIYRIHDEPNMLKLQKFTLATKALGYQFHVKKGKVHSRNLQTLLSDIKEEDKGLSMLLLRMMAKAKYSEKNIGHYGLASSCYTHFTSPIRRYPDLIVHRLLRTYLFHNHVDGNTQDKMSAFIVKAASWSSQKERDAIDCEYEVNDMKKAEFMEQHIGEVYEATISSVTNFGIFATLPNTVEGFIHITDLPGYFVFDDARMSLTSKDIQYRMGQKINIRVKKASKELRQVDFEIIRRPSYGKHQSNRSKQKGRS
ncbi:MAG: ribonuclease R [Bacilli bacterium]|nr:ribonuclease R [Bacilli bacterium]